MNVDELKKNLHNVIERHRNKEEFTGEVCRDVMARDCLQVVEELEAENERLKKFVSKLQGKIDRQGSMLYWLERTNGFLYEKIRNQSKFSRKLRCLALHGMIGYAVCKMNLAAEKYKDDEMSAFAVPIEFSK